MLPGMLFWLQAAEECCRTVVRWITPGIADRMSASMASSKKGRNRAINMDIRLLLDNPSVETGGEWGILSVEHTDSSSPS